jgi:hypothetical protein
MKKRKYNNESSATWSRCNGTKRLNRTSEVSLPRQRVSRSKKQRGLTFNYESHLVPLTSSPTTVTYNYSALGALIENLDIPILTEIVKYIGPNQFRFVAGIHRCVRIAYLLAFDNNKSTYLNASTLAHAKICNEETVTGSYFDIMNQRKALWRAAAMHGKLVSCVQDLESTKWNGMTNLSSTEKDHWSFLYWLVSNGFPPDQCTCTVASMSGHLHVLMWAREHNFPWDRATCHKASQTQHWNEMKWAYNNGCPWDVRCYEDMIWSTRNDNLELLQWARENDCPWDSGTCSSAAASGKLHLLQWAREHNCPWDDLPCFHASRCGNLTMLQWARENGCPWNASICSVAAGHGFLNIVQWARENGCPWNERTCSEAAENGHIPVLQYAREHNCPWDHRTCSYAAANGHLSTLQWARENGCPWNKDTCSAAAEYGHLNVLQWSRQNGCEWDEATCYLAAKNGHVNILQWARHNGCPWDMKTCSRAAQNGHLDVLMWAHDNHCPCDYHDVLVQATKGNHLLIIQWIKAKYYPLLIGPLLYNVISSNEKDEV